MMRVDRWTASDNLKLEPNALVAATEIDRNLALTAGPGAGKTEMLAQRADFLLRTGTCRKSVPNMEPPGSSAGGYGVMLPV
jgi:hypothetical protein